MTKYHSNRTDCYFWLGASAEAETGSREPRLASRPGPTGFDPARDWETAQKADCRQCFSDAGGVIAVMMFLCPTCRNKRCPKATNHRLACTGSNEPGQPGSDYA